MHVLVIPSEEFQPTESHLAGIFQRHQCTAMHKAGWNVAVLSVRLQFSVIMILKAILIRLVGRSPSRGLEPFGIAGLVTLLKDKLWRPAKFITEEVIDGYPVLRVNGIYMRKPSPANDHISWIRAGRIAFDEFVRRYGKPDLIHAHNCNSAGLLAMSIHESVGIPYLITEHSSYYHRKLIPSSLLPRLTSAFRCAKVIGVVSPALGEGLETNERIPVAGWRWIPNVIDPVFESLPTPKPCCTLGVRFLSVGELIPLKGHRELISAFAKAFSRNPGITLRIAGDGVLDSELLNLVEALEMQGRVELLGRLMRTDVMNELEAAHCLVLPSHFETFGVVLLEALAMGRPVIASKCGGPNCIVNNANGILIPHGDIDALATALIQMSRTHGNYDPAGMQRDVFDRFGQKRLLRELNRAYQDCVGQAAKKESN